MAEVLLLQFKSKVPPNSGLIRELDDETIKESDARKARSKEGKPPERNFGHTGVIPKEVLHIIEAEGLKLEDATYQRRLSIAPDRTFTRHVLTTFKYSKNPKNTAKRQKELDTLGPKVIQNLCDQRWERGLVTSFPDTPGLQSYLFVAKAEEPKNPMDIKDEAAAGFGMVVTRRSPEERKKG
jgi:hypothetical protein